MSTTDAAPVVDASAYRLHLLPFIQDWRRNGTRVAIFGTGPHTDLLLQLVPELDGEWLVGFLDSDRSRQGRPYRGRPVEPLAWADENADVVVCSSFSSELAQLQLLARCRAKVIFSRPLQTRGGLETARPSLPANALVVPAESYAVANPEDDRAPLAAIDTLFARHETSIRALLSRLRPYFAALGNVASDVRPAPEPYWNNGFFTGNDARVAYAMVRELKPSRILEIGSGHSTRFMRRAVSDGALTTRLTSIDPSPRADISSACDEQIAMPVQRAPMQLFESLRAGDFLFIDSSHLVFQGSDCAHLFLRILPMLPAGVWVHVHDIFLPDGYPPHFDERFYNEQQLLAALLLHSNTWMPALPVLWLARKGLLGSGGCSFWMVSQRAD